MRSRRVIGLIALCAACAVASVAFVARGADSEPEPTRRPVAGASPAAQVALAPGDIVFRNLDRRDSSHYGFTAAAPLGSTGKRRIAPLVCGRIYFAARRGLCLEPAGALVKQRVTILGPGLKPLKDLTLTGVPSRARVSPDGRYGAVTFFVYGHSYATPGSFSTATTIIDLEREKSLANVESFRVTRDGKEFDSPDFNFWGVSFAAHSDRFYATLSSRGTTYLVEGSVSKRTARVLREGVECPSLSPDQRRIAFKKRDGEGGRWRLHVLDLATLRDRPLAETRSVDDQAEWLDNELVLYGRDESVWVVPADGRGAPRRLLEGADSPAVIRPSA
jgi:hypothetical protein